MGAQMPRSSSRSQNWAFPAELQPTAAETRFDLSTALDALVQVRAEIPDDAFTAEMLGTERVGNGVLIAEGVVLTVGYLITEASSVWLTSNSGKAVQATPVAVDPATGFGLLMPLGKLDGTPIARGSASGCHLGENVIVAGHGGPSHALKASIFARREFAGYWEYLLDDALFTVPAHPQWGGSALLNRKGQLIGIGSLLMQEKMDSDTVQGNMFIPIDLLEPILGDLLTRGRVDRPARPWIGLYAAEVDNRLAVAGASPQGPAERAGIQVGDVIVEVAGQRVQGLADFLRKLWGLGPAGVEVPMTLTRDGHRVTMTMISVDRQQLLKRPQLH